MDVQGLLLLLRSVPGKSKSSPHLGIEPALYWISTFISLSVDRRSLDKQTLLDLKLSNLTTQSSASATFNHILLTCVSVFG